MSQHCWSQEDSCWLIDHLEDLGGLGEDWRGLGGLGRTGGVGGDRGD